jgi:hypothetical protein
VRCELKPPAAVMLAAHFLLTECAFCTRTPRCMRGVGVGVRQIGSWQKLGHMAFTSRYR